MHRLQFHYTFAPTSGTPTGLIRNPLLDLLNAVQESGSISGAARLLDLSYRHVWGELKRWENELGNELLVWEKGQAARLSEFGHKLLWAERQAQARLSPQIEALRADLERAYAVAFDDSVHILTLYASHDDALSALRAHAAAEHQLHLDVRFMGSVDALRALNEGRCVMAGFHTVQQAGAGSLGEQTYKPLLKPGLHKIIGFAQRTQGLMVARGNPLRLHSLEQLADGQVRFVNRALGTGTRLLLDELLAQQRIARSRIKGYRHTEPSHAAVAQAIAAGQADAGLGIEAAARARGLDFVPLVVEDYHLVCLKSALEEPAVQALCRVLQGPDWPGLLLKLPGYQPAQQMGQVLAMSRLLAWWKYRGEKKTRTSAAEGARRPRAQSAQERKPQKMSSRPGRK
ncbi:MAG: LysR family transcriptional regulator [Hylemonella sp.]|uniref:helix-turn-helix transcriptional regulator n=1 Tax=Hylemonella sp. TaxID=2066020 RepID=UPI0022C919AF|nr:substrate-binding domain-containing protein [Hylemonella sp.]MCZ8250939.1 LysR family transcriptional regulator [Hylemonella sp.]